MGPGKPKKSCGIFQESVRKRLLVLQSSENVLNSRIISMKHMSDSKEK